MKAFGRVLTTFGILLLVSFRADAHDASMPHHEWFNAQEMNPAARQRLGVPWKSCCDNGDVFRTRFRVAEDRSDQWQYLKDGGKLSRLTSSRKGIHRTICPCCSSISTRERSSASSCRRVDCDALGLSPARPADYGQQRPFFHRRSRVESLRRKTMALNLRVDCGQTRGQYPAPPP